MKILLDECVDRRFRRALTAHEVFTVPQKGWSGFKNGELLRLAAGEFDVFVTVDRNLQVQHPMSPAGIRVGVLCAKSNRLVDLVPLARALLEAIEGLQPGEVIEIRR